MRLPCFCIKQNLSRGWKPTLPVREWDKIYGNMNTVFCNRKGGKCARPICYAWMHKWRFLLLRCNTLYTVRDTIFNWLQSLYSFGVNRLIRIPYIMRLNSYTFQQASFYRNPDYWKSNLLGSRFILESAWRNYKTSCKLCNKPWQIGAHSFEELKQSGFTIQIKWIT